VSTPAYDLSRLTAEEKLQLGGLAVRKLDERYRASIHDWLAEQVWTIDEASAEIARWPTPAEKPQLPELIDAFEREQRLAVPKSRRMMVTWAFAAWSVWRARYQTANAIYIQSQKESKAAYVIDKRCAWIEDHLDDPELRRPYRALRTSEGLIGSMTYDETQSYIVGLPQGGDAIRMFTGTILILDEIEFQEEGREALVAALPMIEKKAKIVLVSSSNGPRGVLADLCREIGFARFA
jgi:hypothetical protein